jgi:hypothetical protein
MVYQRPKEAIWALRGMFGELNGTLELLASVSGVLSSQV